MPRLHKPKAGRPQNQGAPLHFSLYDILSEQLSALTDNLDLNDQKNLIMKAYEVTCKESLGHLKSKPLPDFSRMNPDGTPFQFSLHLSSKSSSLQYLTEAGILGSSVADRMKLSRTKMHALAGLLHVVPEMSVASKLIDQVAPENDPELLCDAAGAFWVGAGFSLAARPKLTIYVNGSWGSESRQWERISSFVADFGGNNLWETSRKLLCSGMKPLGLAISLSEGAPLSGRVYLRVYGNSLSYFDSLVQLTRNKMYHSYFERFIDTFLGEDKNYPLRSIVCSYGFGEGTVTDFKFELCGHCALENDVIAKEKCLRWFNSVGLNSSAYLAMLRVMAKEKLSSKSIHLHSHIGLGLKEEEVYSTIYFNPNW